MIKQKQETNFVQAVIKSFWDHVVRMLLDCADFFSKRRTNVSATGVVRPSCRRPRMGSCADVLCHFSFQAAPDKDLCHCRRILPVSFGAGRIKAVHDGHIPDWGRVNTQLWRLLETTFPVSHSVEGVNCGGLLLFSFWSELFVVLVYGNLVCRCYWSPIDVLSLLSNVYLDGFIS